MRRARVRAGLLAMATALGLSGCSLEQDVAERPLGNPDVGRAAPAIRGTLLDGSAFDLTGQRGHPVVIDFFASWCGPCHAEQPGLDRVASTYLGRGVTFVGVTFRDNAAGARGYLASEKVPYPGLGDEDGSVASAYNVPAPPSTVLIDAQGRIADEWVGGTTPEKLAQALDALLAGRAG